MRKPSYFETVAASYDDNMDYATFAADCDDSDWTDEDEAALEDWEERRREKIGRVERILKIRA